MNARRVTEEALERNARIRWATVGKGIIAELEQVDKELDLVVRCAELGKFALDLFVQSYILGARDVLNAIDDAAKNTPDVDTPKNQRTLVAPFENMAKDA